MQGTVVSLFDSNHGPHLKTLPLGTPPPPPRGLKTHSDWLIKCRGKLRQAGAVCEGTGDLSVNCLILFGVWKCLRRPADCWKTNELIRTWTLSGVSALPPQTWVWGQFCVACFIFSYRADLRSVLTNPALIKCFELRCFSALSPKTNEVIRVKGATQNTWLSSLLLSRSLATGPVIREANHILIYSVLIVSLKTQISVSNLAFHHFAHR